MRLSAVLPLVDRSSNPDDGVMFAVHCEGHGGRVLLSNDHITGIRNHDHGIDVSWRCDRGHEGVWQITRIRRPTAGQFHVAA